MKIIYNADMGNRAPLQRWQIYWIEFVYPQIFIRYAGCALSYVPSITSATEWDTGRSPFPEGRVHFW